MPSFHARCFGIRGGAGDSLLRCLSDSCLDFCRCVWFSVAVKKVGGKGYLILFPSSLLCTLINRVYFIPVKKLCFFLYLFLPPVSFSHFFADCAKVQYLESERTATLSPFSFPSPAPHLPLPPSPGVGSFQSSQTRARDGKPCLNRRQRFPI